MKLHDIQLLELLSLRPDQGTIFLKDQRMLVQSAAALGLLRKELIEAFGMEASRRLLLRFGYAHGYQDGLNVGQRFGTKSAVEGVEIGCTVHGIEGIVAVEPLSMKNDASGSLYYMQAIWRNSYEAEQHLQHYGKSECPVCWSIIGYASGYASAVMGKDIFYREQMCLGKGDPYCRVEGRDAASWGAQLAELQSDYATAGLTDAASGQAGLRAELDRMHEIARFQNQQLRQYEQRLAGREAESDDLRAAVVDAADSGRFIVRSAAMADALEQAIRVAPINTTVLISGESGTGKEFMVNLIHQQSGRSSEPFVSVNCAALSETLLESELFGHVRGAFTGAVRDKMGLFELARNGTLFLDEVGEMHLGLQAKLLRALENGEIRRVGGDWTIKVRPRIVAATNRDLRAMSEAGKFRSDLFFRLSGFVINLPPLRERPEEIPPLANEFMSKAGGNLHKRVNSITPEAMTCLIRYPWPGNVRELKHAIERAVIVARGSVLDVCDLPSELQASPVRFEEGSLDLKENERTLIAEALHKHSGNRTATARALRISPVTLWRKMKRYGLGDSLSN